MTAHYTFDTTAEGFTGTSWSWQSGQGSPSAGAMGRTTTFTSTGLAGPAVSIAVTSGQPLSFRFKMDGSANVHNTITFGIKDSLTNVLGAITVSNPSFTSGSTGWLIETGSISVTGTAVSIFCNVGDGIANGITAVYVDSLYIAETPPAVGDLSLNVGGIPGLVMVST